MQATTLRMGHARGLPGRRCAVLLLCATLVGCQASSSTASTDATPAATHEATAHDAPRYPDASYSEGRVRPAYGYCVDGVDDAATLQACGREELAYQQQRLQDATRTVVAGLDDAAKAAFLATEADWRRDTDRYCTAAAQADVGVMQRAQECRLMRVANRADALLAQSRPPDTSFTQAPLRAQFIRCVQDARGMNDKLMACDATEFAYQEKQLAAQVSRLMAGPDGPAKDRWMDEQAYWGEDTEKHCAPASDHIGPTLDAMSCRLNRYANRAVELQALTLAPVAAAAGGDAEDDMPARRPDDSYNKATLRPRYTACVEASDAVTPALQACGDEELRYQEERLAAIVATQVARPDSKAKDDWMDAQAAWWADTDRYCTWDPRTEGQGQMLDAQSCRINRVANRVDQLNAATGQR